MFTRCGVSLGVFEWYADGKEMDGMRLNNLRAFSVIKRAKILREIILSVVEGILVIFKNNITMRSSYTYILLF